MNQRDDLVWAAVYAASWIHASSRFVMGVPGDRYRAAAAEKEADRAVAALREIGAGR